MSMRQIDRSVCSSAAAKPAPGPDTSDAVTCRRHAPASSPKAGGLHDGLYRSYRFAAQVISTSAHPALSSSSRASSVNSFR